MCNHFSFSLVSYSEAEKAAQVSKIQYDQKIVEKESLRKMSEIEGGSFFSNTIQCYIFIFVCMSLSSSVL